MVTEPTQYLPIDYRTVPWNRRPLAMQQYERNCGQPFEVLLTVMWFKYRNWGMVCRKLNLEDTTARRWRNKLGLYICLGCSKKNGKLFNHITKCYGCDRYLCDDCIKAEGVEHFLEVWCG